MSWLLAAKVGLGVIVWAGLMIIGWAIVAGGSRGEKDWDE